MFRMTRQIRFVFGSHSVNVKKKKSHVCSEDLAEKKSYNMVVVLITFIIEIEKKHSSFM